MEIISTLCADFVLVKVVLQGGFQCVIVDGSVDIAKLGILLIAQSNDRSKSTFHALFLKISIFLRWSLPSWIKNLRPVVWEMPVYSEIIYDRSGLNLVYFFCMYRKKWSIAWHASRMCRSSPAIHAILRQKTHTQWWRF